MPSTYTSSNRFEKPGQFEQDSTWGLTANTDFDLIDTAISGAIAISLPDTNYTLTANNGAADQARYAVLGLSGTLTATRTITIPTTSKIYLVNNTTAQSLVFSRGTGTTATVAAGLKAIVVNDGTNVYVQNTNATDASTLNGQPGSFYQNANNLTAGTVPTARLPVGTTGASGIVQLVDSVASTSTAAAAVPNSVKTAYDAATAAATTANNASNTANTASTNASNAVSTANTALGTANSAASAAGTAQTTANNAQSAAGTAQGTANTAQARLDARTSPTLPFFNARAATNQGSGTTIIFGTATQTQQGSGYNPATGIFTAGATAVYCFATSVSATNNTGAPQIFAINFSLNGSAVNAAFTVIQAANSASVSLSAAIKMNAGDTVAVVTTAPGLSGVFFVVGGTGTYFTGYFVG